MKKYCLLCWLLVITLIACQSPDPNPDPANFIAGDYTAIIDLNTGLPYPINGKTFTMQIRRITNDTVQVNIQADANYVFSPGQNLIYSKAYVASSSNTIAKQSGSYKYNVFLIPRIASNINSLKEMLQIYTNEDDIYIDYHFVPAGGKPETETITRLKRI